MTSALEAVAKLPCVLERGRAEFEVIGLVCSGFFEAQRQFCRAFSRRRDASAQVETPDVHVLLITYGDFEFVEVEERHGHGGQIVEQGKQLRLLIWLTGSSTPTVMP